MSSNKAKQDACSKAAALSRLACVVLASTALIGFSTYADQKVGSIVAGQGGITSSPSFTLIHQHSKSLIIDWESFNIGVNELVKFDQPSSRAAALNRIQDQMPSEIFGSLQANGLILLMNPNGVIFGESASVQVGGLVATNLEIDADLFMRGNYNLESLNAGGGMIINRGLIAASTGGVSLISDTGVINEGKILATFGSINLATAKTATLDFDGDKLLQLSVDGEVLLNALALDAAITNSGQLIAEGGDVIISGKVARDVFSNVVNNTGIIKATRIVNEGGVIRLTGLSGDINNSGALDVSGSEAGNITVTATNIISSGLVDASATEGNGGNITLQSTGDTLLQGNSLVTAQSDKGVGGVVQVLGNRVGVFDNSVINASGLTGGGEVLIGGDFQGKNASIQNASQTFVGADTSVIADGIARGDGGKVIIWADNTTQYYGDISVTGGLVSGDGGLVEVSGKQFLSFDGAVDVTATNGTSGKILLDPDNIIIENGSGSSDDGQLGDNTIAFTDGGSNDYNISEVALEGLTGNVVLQAEVNITMQDLGVLDFQGVSSGESVVFQAGNNIVFQDSANEIRTNGGDIILEANSPDASSPDGNGILNIGNLNSQGGNITLLGTNFTINSTVEAGSGDIFISTSDGSAIDLDSFFSQNEYNRLNTTGNLTIGMATTAGTNGLGAGSVVVYASSLSLSQSRTINPGTNATVNLVLDTGNLTIDGGDTLTVGADLIIDTGGTVDINGNIVAGSNNVTIIASDIRGDGGSGQEISSAGTLTLTADVIGVADSTFNINNVTTLIINDQAAGDIEINFSGGTGIELGVAANDLTATDLGSVTDFTYNNTFSSISLGTISATGKNLTINATGDITDNTSAIAAANLTLTTGALDAVIGANGSEINTTLSGNLTATASNGVGGIYINQTGDIDIASINTDLGNLELTASGSIGDTGAQTVGGAASFTVGNGGDIILNAGLNNYTSTVSFAPSAGMLNDVTFFNDASIDLQGNIIGGNLLITSANGAVMQSGVLDVTGTSSFNAALDNNITLGQANTFNGAVSLSTSGMGNVLVTDADAIQLGTVSLGGGTLTVNAGTDIIGNSALTVGGAATFNVGTVIAGNITLNNMSNTFGDTVTFSSATGLGNVSLVDTTAYDVQAGGLIVSGDLGITAAGITQTGGALSVLGGTASFSSSGVNDITLEDATNDFGGAVSLNTVTGNASIMAANTIDMGASNVGGDLAVTSVAGAIMQTSGTLSVTGVSSFTAALDNDITLNQTNNTFGSTVNLSTSGIGSVSVTDAGTIELGAVSVDTGTFSVTAVTAINDLDGQAVDVNGAASFTVGGGGDILLDNPLNNYTSTVSFTPSGGTLNDVAFVNSATIDLQASAIGGNLSITSVTGAVMQSGVLDVTGTSSFTAALDNDITLNQANTFGSTVNLSTSGTGSVSVTDADTIELGAVSVDTGTFSVTAATAINDLNGQAVDVNGAASFTVDDGGNIILDNPLNNYTSTVSFAPSIGMLNDVSFVNDATINLQASTIGGNLLITSMSGAIAQSGILAVTGTSSFNAALNNNVMLNQANTFGGAVSLSTSGTGNVSVTDADAITLGTVSVGSGTLTVNAATDITGNSAITAGGAATFNAGTAVTGNIILGNTSNSFSSAVTFNTVAGLGNLTLADTTAYDVQAGGLTVSGNLDIAAAGITQTGGALSVVGGTSSFTASGANDIDLMDATNDFGGTVNLNTGTGNASITDANAIDLGVSNVGGDLTVIATTGSITGNSSGTVTVGGNASLTANTNGQTIGTALTALSTAISGSLTANATTGSGGIYINDTGSLEINILDAGTGNVELTSGGTITDATGADTTIDVRANALTLTAVGGTGVDAADALNLDVNSLTITPSPGNFFLTEAGILNLNSVTVGSINLFTFGNLTVLGNITTTSGDLALGSAGVLSIFRGGVGSIGPDTEVIDPFIISTQCPPCIPPFGDRMFAAANTYDSVTLTTPALTGDIILRADNIDITNGVMDTYLSTGIVVPNIFGGLDFFYNQFITQDATLNAGTNSVIFDTNTASNVLTLGTMITQGEINRITAASTIQFGTINNTGGIQLTSNFNTSVTPNTALLTSGAVTSSLSTNTLTADGLSIIANGGIGAIGSAFGIASNSISAVNNVSGDIFLSITGANVTLGGAGTITNNVADSTIGISSTGNLIIDTDFSVSGNGTISLDATGTITRTGGTVTANTVNLGTGAGSGTPTTTSIGAGGAPILVSTANLNAESTVGDIYLENDQAVNLALNSAGLADFTNTAGGITVLLGQAVSATGDLTLRADDMEFITGTTVSGANVNLYTQSATAGFLLGDNTDVVNRVELGQAELQTLSSSGVVTIGENGVMTGDIILGGTVNLSTELFGLTLTTTGAIDTPSTTNILTLASGEVLTLDALNIGATNPIETVATVLNLTTNNGNINLDNGTDVNDIQLNAGLGIVDINNTGFMAATTALIAGEITIDVADFFYLQPGSSLSASTGDISLSVAPAGSGNDFIILDNTSSITASMGDLFLTADRMIFDFNGASTLSANNITISPFTITDPDGAGPLEAVNTVIGSLTLDFSDAFEVTMNLNSNELAMLDSTGNVTIGGASYTGNVDMGRDIVDLSAENFDFTVTTTGAIDDDTLNPSGNPLILNAGKLLTLNAGTGIGNTNAVTFTTASVSALNTTSGSLSLAPTGDITLGGVGITIDQQAPDGALNIIAGGNIIIDADVSVSGAGASTVTLDATGTITRTGGTVIADTVNLGSTNTMNVGAPGASVLVDAQALNLNNTGDAYVEGVNATGSTVVRGTTMTNLTYVQNGTGSVSLGNIGSIAMNALDVTTNGASDVDGVVGEGVLATTVNIISAGSIGRTTQLTVDATNSLNLESNGNGMLGDINIRSTSATISPTITTDAGSTQTISLELPDFNISAPIILLNDNLLLNANTGNILLGANVNVNNLYLISSGIVAQTAGMITTNELLVNSTGAVTLNNAGNDVDIIAGSVSLLGADFTYRDANALIVGSITEPINTVTTDGITTNGGNINLTTGGMLSQSATGAISGALLTANAAGGILLNNATNTVGSINAIDTAGGSISFANGAALDVANLNTTGDALLAATSLTDSGQIVADLLTTITSNGSVLNTSVFVTDYNGTDTGGSNIILVNNGGLNLTGINTTGIANISAVTGLTGSGVITAGLLAVSTDSGGITLNNPSNNVGAFSAINKDGSNISLVDTGSLDIRGVVTGGNITITSGSINQSQDVASFNSGNITVTADAGGLTMANGSRTITIGGTITYNAVGDVNLSLLNAAPGISPAPANVGTISVTSTNGSLTSVNQFIPSVRANTVNLDAAVDIGRNSFDAFILSSDIQGQITLNYLGQAFLATFPGLGVQLNIVDFGSGFINAGAARSAGTQRSQNTGLEDIGFIDLALFSDINLFVVDGIGIKLPASQNDVAPSVIEDLPIPDRIPVEDDDEEERRQLNVSTAY